MKTENKTLGIAFGIMSKSVGVQLRAQRFKFDKEKVRHFQLDVDAMNRLRINDLMTDTVAEKIRLKLYRKIVRHVMAVNKLRKVHENRK